MGTFIRIDFLFPCFGAAHSLCPILTRFVWTRPCVFVAWLKPVASKSFGRVVLSASPSHAYLIPAWTPRYARSRLRNRTIARAQRVTNTLSFWRCLFQWSKFRETCPRIRQISVSIDVPIIINSFFSCAMSKSAYVDLVTSIYFSGIGNVSSFGT